MIIELIGAILFIMALPIMVVLGLIATAIGLLYLYFWQVVSLVVFWGVIAAAFAGLQWLADR